MNFNVFELQTLGANCYVLWDEKTTHAMIIDPGEPDDRIDSYIEENALTPVYIILTHTHFDHINGTAFYSEKYGAKIAVHELDANGLTDSTLNLSAFFGLGNLQKNADIILKDGDRLNLGSSFITIIHTPGHTAGGICLKTDIGVFSGDTLFYESVGRSDFPGGDALALYKSITEKLFSLPDDTHIYPGHGQFTTIDHEKKHNFFIKR